ncbi:MAG: hypothetical protein M3R70_12555 [Actinomycetota bacterium]|nr:hypothetical protein [Actinomycetota bacterium]
MGTQKLECLHCGKIRHVDPDPSKHFDGGECPRCQYVGWALVRDLDERVRGLIRGRPLMRRRLHAA